LHFGKRVENRQWAPFSGNAAAARRLVERRERFLIHAAKGCTRGEYEDACDFMRSVYREQPWEGSTIVPHLDKMTRGALVASARIVSIIETDDFDHRLAPGKYGPGSMCLLCGQEAAKVADCPKADPWAIPGGLGLILADVEPLPTPIPFKGALGFFDVPDYALEAP
jgi:hypothetical protein